MHAMHAAIIETPPKFDGFQRKPSIMGPFGFFTNGIFRTFSCTNILLLTQKSNYALFMQLFQRALYSRSSHRWRLYYIKKEGKEPIKKAKVIKGSTIGLFLKVQSFQFIQSKAEQPQAVFVYFRPHNNYSRIISINKCYKR